jgi:protein-disulfide isomerase
MRITLPSVLTASLVLVSCVDTTGLSAETSRGPHPDSNPNAVVTVQEYADLQCPACKTTEELVTKPLLAAYGSQIRFEYMHMPLSSIHRYAIAAAEAAECAADQGKFWEYVDTAYENQEQLNDAALEQWARELSLDMELFNRCMQSHIKRDLIQEEYDAAREAGIGGTPTFLVNGERVESTLNALSEAIEAKVGSIGERL